MTALLALGFWLALILGAYFYGVRVGIRGALPIGHENGRREADAEWAMMMENGYV